MTNEIREEEWEYFGNNPSWKANYKCTITNSGKWHIESDKFNSQIKLKENNQ